MEEFKSKSKEHAQREGGRRNGEATRGVPLADPSAVDFNAKVIFFFHHCPKTEHMLTSQNSHQQSSIKVQLDRLENTGLNLSTESATHLNKLRGDILGAVRQLMERNENLEESVNTTAELKEGVWEVRDSLKTLSSMMSAVPRENSILQNLFFPSMNLREETIASAEEGTFKWIFEEEDNPH